MNSFGKRYLSYTGIEAGHTESIFAGVEIALKTPSQREIPFARLKNGALISSRVRGLR